MDVRYSSEESVSDTKATPSNVDIPKTADAIPPNLMTMPAEIRLKILEELVQEHNVELSIVLGFAGEIREFYTFGKGASVGGAATRNSLLGVLGTNRQLRSEIASCISKTNVSLILRFRENSRQVADIFRGTTFLKAIRKHPLWVPLVKHVIFDTHNLVRQDTYSLMSVVGAFPSLRKITVPGVDFYPPRRAAPYTARIDHDSYRMHLVQISQDCSIRELETFRGDYKAIGGASKRLSLEIVRRFAGFDNVKLRLDVGIGYALSYPSWLVRAVTTEQLDGTFSHSIELNPAIVAGGDGERCWEVIRRDRLWS